MTSDDDVRYLNATPEDEAADRAHWERRRIELARMFDVPVEKMTIGHAMWFDRPPINGERSAHKWPTLASFDILASTRPASSGIRYAMAKDVLATSETKGEHFVDVHAEGAAPLEEATGRSLRGFLDSARYVLAYTGPMTPFFTAPYSIGARVSLDDAEAHDVTGRVVYLCAEELDEEEGVLAIDARFARHLESIGDNGRALAAMWRKDAEARWAKKHDTVSLLDPWSIALQTADIVLPTEGEQPPPVMSGTIVPPASVKTLARALWRDVVGPRLARERRKPAALVMAVAEPVAGLFSKVRREEEHNGQRSLRLPGEVLARVSTNAASIGADTINAIMANRGVKLFGSVASHKMLRWQIFTAHKQALEHNPDPRLIRIEGGYSVLAHDVLGLSGKKAAEHVRDIIEAMHATELPLPPHGHYSRLLIRETHTPRGRGKQWIKLVLGTALLPDYVSELQKVWRGTLDSRRGTRLVPVLEIPPLLGAGSGERNNEMGAQATFSMLLVAHLRDHARELVQHGGVSIPRPQLEAIATAAGLPLVMVPKLVDRWLSDGFDGPAFLKKVGRDRYTLGDAHEKERAFIEEGGRQELQGSVAGEKGAAKKRSKLARLGRK